jgi:hypothetical protein
MALGGPGTFLPALKLPPAPKSIPQRNMAEEQRIANGQFQHYKSCIRWDANTRRPGKESSLSLELKRSSHSCRSRRVSRDNTIHHKIKGNNFCMEKPPVHFTMPQDRQSTDRRDDFPFPRQKGNYQTMDMRSSPLHRRTSKSPPLLSAFCSMMRGCLDTGASSVSFARDGL